MAALRYVHTPDEAARDAAVAAFVASAQERADAMPGAVPRCTACRKPAAECVCGASPVPQAEPPPPAPVTAGERCRRCGYALAKCDCHVRYSHAGRRHRRGEP